MLYMGNKVTKEELEEELRRLKQEYQYTTELPMQRAFLKARIEKLEGLLQS